MAPQCIPEVIFEVFAAVRNEVRKDVASDVEYVSSKFGVGDARKIAHGPKGLNTNIWKHSYHRRECNRHNNVVKLNQI